MNRKERRAAGRLRKPSIPRGGLEPSLAESLLARGKELAAAGDDEGALLLACRIIRMEETPATKAFFIQCVKDWSYFPGATAMQDILSRALREGWTWPTEILATVLGILERDPLIASALDRAARAWPRRLPADELPESGGLAAIAAHPLLPALLESLAVPDRRFERLLTTLRFIVLEAAMTGLGGAAPAIRFAVALAQQCFINEYIYDVGAEEAARVDTLRQKICAASDSGAPVEPLWLAAIAAYVRLDALPIKPLWKRPWPDSLLRLIDQQVREPAALARLRASIPRLTPIANAISLKVKHQYEENPYPRWVRSAAITAPVPLAAELRREFPNHDIPDCMSTRPLDVLVAGCGTGQQSIDFAQRYQGAKVLAVDLALSSLAYAIAKTQAARLSNITYAQADILELGGIGKTFDVIVSTGVLHHLADPIKGWRMLASLLRPGGFMLVGLYSELARRDIVAAQKWVAAQGYRSTADDIRAARQELLRIDDASWQGIFTMRDFFTTSECRDLLFHVQEHRFTLPQIADFLRKNDLKFLGFKIGAKIRRQFQARFPAPESLADLNHWHIFETENPATFINMYQFWVQKPRAE